MSTWAKVEETVSRFSAETAQLGPQFTSICAVHDALGEQTATQGVGLLDAEALLQLFASMVDTAAHANNWSVADVQTFLDRVSSAVSQAHAADSSAPWPLV